MRPQDIKIIYIAGYSRSGSTLLDIMIGNFDGNCSCGEISFLPENGIRDREYCSCGSHVVNCSFWKEVIHTWDRNRSLSNDEYIAYNKSFFRNKRIASLIWKFLFPDEKFRVFMKDTQKLYESIWFHNHHKVIIDSSKSPYRLLLLKKIGFEITTIHLIRSIKGVLYSTSKLLKTDPEAGIEKAISPRKKMKVIFTWVLANILTRIFTIGNKRIKITYEGLLSKPYATLCSIPNIVYSFKDDHSFNGPFYPQHLVAGGRVRMHKEVFLDKNLLNTEKIHQSICMNNFYSTLDRIIK
jgi:hypothetical protein